ncbi:hypothetical protein [Sinimarinibacterium thermocellulolyticum]|uniref:Uncharacterized protein n=1 Tax=Sinimarinibacterium thermocellulolyticum TaxID=3170016 RepID=A0ABV2A7C4_9GAMM
MRMFMTTDKRLFPRTASIAGLVLVLSACGGGGGGGGNPIPLDQPDALMESLNDKIASPNGGIEFVPNATPPAPTGDGQTPKVAAGVELTAEPGDTVSLPVSIGGAPDLSALFAKIPGASSYFQVNLGGGGGSKAARRAAKQATGGFVLTTIIGFNVTLPQNLATGGAFCFEFAAKDAAGNVSSPDVSCITVVAEKPVPMDDQPSAAQTAAALQGSWQSPCFDVSDDFDEDGTIESDEQESVREVINFVGTDQYATFFDFYAANRTCSGTAERLQAPGGTYALGNSAQPDSQGKYARAIDFVPNPDDPNFGDAVSTCYNLLRLEGSGGSIDTLLLGYPIPFAFDFEGAPEPVSGDCRSPQTRPTAVIPSLPFSRG